MFLLYPSEESIAAEYLAGNESSNRDANIKRTFILLDGTWRKAFKMYQSSINLQNCQLCD